MKLAPLLLAALLAGLPLASRAHMGQDQLIALLQKQDYPTLERTFSAVQRRFEAGELTEYELRDAFQPIAMLKDAAARESLREWAQQSPESYVAHLALGLNYRARGSAARGKKYWDDTPPEKQAAMLRDYALAEPELRKSLALTPRPFLSAVNLMGIIASVGKQPYLNASLMLANEARRDNSLARLQFARFLLPRWGGSYEKFDAFVDLCREQGVAESTLLKMQAIELNDRGMVQRAGKDPAGARALFEQALQLAQRAGDEGGFRAVYLKAAVEHVCNKFADLPACQPAPPVARPAPGVVFDGPLGGDIEHAIVVPTVDDSEGVRSEYAWLALRYPGGRRTSQAVIPRAGREYDMLAVTTADGQELQIYFDITAFYRNVLKPREPGKAGQPEPGKT